MEYRLNASELREKAGMLRVFDTVSLSGVVYTARDAAHKKIFALLDSGAPLPFELEGATIYYAGPTQTPPGRAIGACGPNGFFCSQTAGFGIVLYDRQGGAESGGKGCNLPKSGGVSLRDRRSRCSGL